MDGQMYRQEAQLLLSSAHHLRMLYISMMFHENILKQFSSNRVDTICDRQTDRQSDGQPNKAKTIML